jgi:hypothetical protein
LIIDFWEIYFDDPSFPNVSFQSVTDLNIAHFMNSLNNQLPSQEDVEKLVFPLACLISASDRPIVVRAMMLRSIDFQVKGVESLAKAQIIKLARSALSKGNSPDQLS